MERIFFTLPPGTGTMADMARMLREVISIGVQTIASLCLVACSSHAPAPMPAPTPTSQPVDRLAPTQPATRTDSIEVAVEGKRVGSSLQVGVTGLGRARVAGGAFEDTRQWNVVATYQGQQLQRVLNGPTRVSRTPVGDVRGSRWDVSVAFSIGFALEHHAEQVEVTVTPPESRPRRAVIKL